MKRFLVWLLVFAMLLNTVAFAVPEMAGTVEEVVKNICGETDEFEANLMGSDNYVLYSDVSSITANTSNTQHKYSKYWQYWSQGASMYPLNRSYGCRMVAYSKMLVECGAFSSDTNEFNPDIYYKWALDNNQLSDDDISEANRGKSVVNFAAAHGVNLTYEGEVYFSSSTTAGKATEVMDYINRGYYVVLRCTTHSAYVGKQLSLTLGTPIILDSFSSHAVAKTALRYYNSNFDGASFVSMMLYSYSGDVVLTANTTNTATISTGGQMVYYSYTPAVSDYYTIFSTGSSDTKVYLYDSNGNELDSDDDDGDDTNFYLRSYLTAGNTYTFGIMYYDSSATGNISFWFGDLNNLNVSSTYGPEISSEFKSVYYTFTPSTSNTYVIYSIGSDDTKVILYDLSLTQLASDDDGGNGNNFRLSYDLVEGNTYIYKIFFYDSSKNGEIMFRFDDTDKNGHRIVSLSTPGVDENGYYRNYYELFNPFTGSREIDVCGNDSNITYEGLIDAIETGYVVELKNGMVDELGYISDINDGGYLGRIKTDETKGLVWFTEYDATNNFITVVPTSVTKGVSSSEEFYTLIDNYKYDGGEVNFDNKELVAVDGADTIRCEVTDDTSVVILKYDTAGTNTTKWGTMVLGDIWTIGDSLKENKCYYQKWVDANGNFITKYAPYLKGYVSYTEADGIPVADYIVIVVNSLSEDEIGMFASDTYTVRYNANGGSNPPASQTKTHGVNLTLSSTKPTKTGYTFKGWSTSNDSTVEYASGASYTNNANVTLYAVWQANTYTLTFNANGGSNPPASQTKTHGVNLTLSSTKPTKTGYTFKGWSTTNDSTVEYASGATYSTNANVTLYAVWEANTTYEVIYYANRGNGEPENQTKAHGVNLKLSTTVPVREGYEFIGWSSNTNGIVDYQPGDVFAQNKKLELIAVWEKTDNSDVVFSAGNGTLMYHSSGVDVRSNVDNSTGETWYDLEITNSTNPLIAFPYERFEAENYKFMIVDFSVKADEGFDEKMSIYFKNDVYTTLDEAKTFKYSFKSSTEETRHKVIFDLSNNEYWTGLVDYVRFDPTSKSTGIVKLYGITFTDDITYDVDYDLNGGSGNIPSQVKSHDKALTLSSTVPTKTGYTFLGWSTSNDSTVEYASGASYTNNANITLFAVWEENKQPEPEVPVNPNAPAVTLSSVKTTAGKQVVLNLDIKNNPGIAGITVEIEYDRALVLEKVEKGTALSSLSFMEPNNIKANPVKMIWFSTDNDSSNGKIAALTFTVPENTPEGTYNISVNVANNGASNSALESIHFETVNGIVTVIDAVIGDTTGDNSIDIRDVILLAQYCADWQSAIDKVNPACADTNGDGSVDIRDVILLAQFCAGWDVSLG